jgi:hypothetical protein
VKRIVEPEFLDTLPPDDPRAIHSRCDLRRINWWMGNADIMANALKENCSVAPKQITELGAGDGNFLLRVAEKINWQNANAILLDRQKNVSTETLAAFAKLDWRAETIVTDVFEWSDSSEIVIANLFLHHFEDSRLVELLQKISAQAKLFIAIEPRRFEFPFLCNPLLWLIGCNSVTRHDAIVSVRAGFSGNEISKLWPDKKIWQLTERGAGSFSHLFVARKIS